MSGNNLEKNVIKKVSVRVIVDIDLNDCSLFAHKTSNHASESEHAVCACFSGENDGTADKIETKRFWCRMLEELLSRMDGEVNEDNYTQIRDEVTRIMADAAENTVLSCVAEEISKVQKVNERADKGDATRAELIDALHDLWQRLNNEVGSLKELLEEPTNESTAQGKADKVLDSHVENQKHLENFHALFSEIWTALDNIESPEAYAEQRGRLNGAVEDALSTKALSDLTSDLKGIQNLNELAGCGDATRAQIIEALDNLCSNIAKILLDLQKEQKISAAIDKVVGSLPEGVKSWLIPIIVDVLAELDDK